MQVSCVEGPFAWLVNDRLSRHWIKLRDNVMAALTADQDPPHWTHFAYALAWDPPFYFGKRRIS
jgi:hypothetical protein